MSRRSTFRVIAVSMCAALAASGEVAFASDPLPTVVIVDPIRVEARPDRVSAMTTARAQESRVEDLSQSTPTTATFANPDGTWTTESYSGVVRSKVDDNAWVSADAAVEKQGDGYEPKAAPFNAEFSDGGDRTIGTISPSEDSTIDVGWPTKLPVPRVDGEQLTYPNAAPDADLVVSSFLDGFNYSVVLNEAPAENAPPVEYRIPLTFSGAAPVVKADGSIVVKDGTDRVASMTAPVMWDASEAAEAGEPTRRPVGVAVEGEGASRTLVLKPDMAFLRDPVTVYPVTVDPTINVNAANDTWVNSITPTSSQYNSAELQVGSATGTSASRSYVYFNFVSLPAGSLISAEVRMSNFETGSCTGSALRMSRITQGWSVPALTWGAQPTTTTTGSSTSTAGFGATGCAAEGNVTFDATAIASAWGTGQPNYGVQIKADNETNNSGYRRFRSLENGDLAKVPTFVWNYNAPPSTPTDVTVSPGYTGYVSSLTPTFSAVVSDPDGGQARGFFQVRSGSTIVWSGTSPMDVSGARVSVTMPSGVLTNGTAYTVAVFSQDGTLTSQNSAPWKPFTVDVTAPTVAITWSPFTNGSWLTNLPASNTLTLDGSTDTAGFYTTLDGVPYSVGANGSGDYTSTTWLPTSGWHTLEAAPIDKAGNLGAKSTFSFGAGSAGMSPPIQNARSTSTFPIEMTAPPNATGATVSWKLAGETTWRAASNVTKAGLAWTGTVSTAGGRSTAGALLWSATSESYGAGTLAAPAVVQLRGCFQYSAVADSCTGVRTVELVPSAFGGNFPEVTLGPAAVALFSGEASISAFDAADSKAGLGRTFSSYDTATIHAGVFGPGWSEPEILMAPSADARASVIDNRTKDGSFVIVEPDTGSETFIAETGSTTSFVPLQPTGDATKLTFTPGSGGNPDALELTRPLGSGSVKTTWGLAASDTGGSPDWTVTGLDAPGTAGDISVTSSFQRPIFVRESDPGASATCTATTQTLGCRGLKITYTGTGAATRVSSVAKVIGAATQAAVTTTTIASYTYTSGSLTSVCSASPAAGKPALCTTYAYTTVGGRTLLSQSQPPGLKPWRFAYDATGRLLSAKREKPAGGDATWSVDYGLAVSASGLPDLSASAAAQWGQQTIPTKVFAVYQPFTGGADNSKAQLYYTTNDGTLTNTATHGPAGWLLDTSWYDANGSVVQQLDNTGWARAQAAPSSDRLRVASEASSFTVYNTWGDANTAGTRVVDEYGPAHTATLKNQTTGLFRTHTHTMYDDDPNVDTSLIASRPGSTGLGLVVRETTSVSNATRTADYDSVVAESGYEPIVAGDANGWTLGVPTSVRAQIDSNTWSTEITRYDTAGRRIESRAPGGAEDASHAGTDAHSTVYTYYTAGGSGECGGKPSWDGLVCKVGPAAQPTGPTIPITYFADFSDDLAPTSIQESSGGVVTRTTTMTYDSLGRSTGVTKTTTGPDVANETIASTFIYDDATGLRTTVTSGGQTVTSGFDAWGRTSSYVDGAGTSSATTYDAAGNVDTFYDGQATYTYSYDSHNVLTEIDTGIGTFAMDYEPSGAKSNVTYPNGMIASFDHDEVGVPTGLDYSDASGQKLLSFRAAVDVEGRVIVNTSNASRQHYNYDAVGRLTGVQDTQESLCTTRSYGISSASQRTSFASYAADVNGACQDTSPSITKVSTYDAADRIRNAGYTYDTLGRTLTTPSADTASGGTGPLTSTYFANDMVKSLTQTLDDGAGGSTERQSSYVLDAAGRIQALTNTSNSTETDRFRYLFSDASDSPTSIEASTDGGVTWTTTRFIAVPGLGMTASVAGTAVTYQLANLHGDIVATQVQVSGPLTIDSYNESDEYGNPVGTSTARYGWLGKYQRSADTVGGLILMGARLYNPATGLFSSIDPVRRGNATRYGYPLDPVNATDLNGQWCAWGWGTSCDPPWVPNWKNNKVYIYDHVADAIWEKHRIRWDTIAYVIKKGRFIGYSPYGIARNMYGYTLRLFNIVNGQKVYSGRSVRIEFVVEWGAPGKGVGDLVTMYCSGYPPCPSWVAKYPTQLW